MWTQEKRERGIRVITEFSRPYRRLLISGILWTVGVVLFRLAMPWPLRGVLEIVFPHESGETAGLVEYLPAWGDPVVWFGLFYLVFAAGAGLTAMLQRIDMMRFSAQTVHDLRAAAVKGSGRLALRGSGTGDLIARVVGDAARIKAGLSGILVHVSQNGLLFVGICVVFLYISPKLGLFFVLAGGLALLIGFRASGSVADSAQKHRRMEGDFASTLEDALAHGDLGPDLEDLNLGSAQKDVNTTRLITRSTLHIHIVLAVVVGLAMWVGAKDVAAGRLAPGHIFLFIAYALTLHRRTVQIGRQVARSGKVLACANRIGFLLKDSSDAPESYEQHKELRSGLRLEDIVLPTARKKGDRARLKRVTLSIKPGERIAVIGGIGAGKSSLLRVVAGVESVGKGTIIWDEVDITEMDGTLRANVGYVPQEPVFPSQVLWKSLGLDGPDSLSPDQQRILEAIGIWPVIRRMPKAMETKVASINFSRNEARLFSLAGLVMKNRSPIWVVDNPLEGLRGKAARRCFEEILSKCDSRALVMAQSRPFGLERFDKVLLMRRGKLVFAGTAVEWKNRKTDRETDE